MDPRSEGAPAPRSEQRLLRGAAGLALLLAVALRLAFLGGKPFWSDEAWVAHLAELPLGELFDTIRKTTAPVGFVLVVKLASLIPGLPPEIALRLLPLAAGIATVLLLPRLVRALGGSPRAATLAVLLAAAMPALVHYSRELKPYAIDALVATAFPLAALRLMAAEKCGGSPLRRRTARYLPAGIALATPLFSFGGIFPVAATLAWGWAHLLRRRILEARRPWALASGAFVALLAALGAAVIYLQATNPVLARSYRVVSGEGSPLPAAAAGRLLQLVATASQHLFPGAPKAGLLLVAAGFLAWPRPGRGAAAGIAGGAALLAAGATAAGFYAVNYGRLVLFAAPLLVAAAAIGWDRALELPARRGLPRGAATAVALFIAGSLAAFWTVRDLSHRLHPERTGFQTAFLYDGLLDVPALVEETVRRRAPGEPVAVAHAMNRSVEYYARGRLGGAVPLPSKRQKRFLLGIQRWLAAVPDRGWLLLNRKLVSPGLRGALERRGFTVAREIPFRGVALWELRRASGVDSGRRGRNNSPERPGGDIPAGGREGSTPVDPEHFRRHRP